MSNTTKEKSTKNTNKTLVWLSRISAISYVLAWIVGLSSGVPNIALNANVYQVIFTYARHLGAAKFQFLVAEGLTGILLATVIICVILLAHTTSEYRRVFRVAGLSAAVISVGMAAVGLLLLSGIMKDADMSQILRVYRLLNRLDGPKMILLAIMAISGSKVLPSAPIWFKYLSYVLALALVVSGVAYGFLLQSIAWTAYISGSLLLIWVGSLGLLAARRKVVAAPKAV